MKKSILIPFLIIPFVLVSCSDENKQTTTPTTQNISSGSTQTLPKANTGTLAQSGIVQAVAVSTWSIEVVKPLPTRTLAIKNNNIVLLEDGKEINKLTVKGNTDFKNVENCGNNEEKTAYKILQAVGKFWIAQKQWNSCGWPFSDTYYAMSLMDGSMELTDVSKYVRVDDGFWKPEISHTNEKLIATISWDNIVATEMEMEPGLILASNVKKAWFIKSGKNWIKTINLEKVLPKPTSNIPTVWKYIFHTNELDGNIEISNLTTTSFDANFFKTDGDKVGGGISKAKKNQDGSWILTIVPEMNNESPSGECNKMSAVLRFAGEALIVKNLKMYDTCFSGIAWIEETTYIKK